MRAWRTFFALLLGLGLRPAFGAEATPSASGDHAEERQILDLDLARFYTLITQDNDPRTKTILRGYHQEYARRAGLLFQNFDAKKYDDLRYDINVQCQRQARKLAPRDILPRTKPGEGVAELPLGDLNPSPADPLEVKAALAAADDAIQRQEDRAGKLPPAVREREKARIQQLKERRAELGRRFTKPGWDALVGELNLAAR